jgi:hypothetical protein
MVRAEFMQAEENKDERVRDAGKEHPAAKGKEDDDAENDEGIFQKPVGWVMRTNRAQSEDDGEKAAENQEPALVGDVAKHG